MNKKLKKITVNSYTSCRKNIKTIAAALNARAIAVLVAFVVFCALYLYYQFKHNQTDSRPAAIKVALAYPKLETLTMTVQTVGTIRASQEVEISSESAGTITAIYMQSGQEVSAGQLLLSLDSQVLKTELAKAQAKFKLADSAYNRSFKLYHAKAIAAADMDNTIAERQTAEAEVQNIMTQLQKKNITAPFAGKIGIHHLSAGQYIGVGEKIVSLEDTHTLYVDFSVPEVNIFSLRNSLINLTTALVPGKIFVAKIIATEAKVSATTHMLPVVAVVDNKDNQLLSGMFVNINYSITEPSVKLTIPQSAIVYGPEGTFVYVIRQAKAHAQKMGVAELFADKAVVQQGLKTSDAIVANGQINLYEGAAVRTEGLRNRIED